MMSFNKDFTYLLVPHQINPRILKLTIKEAKAQFALSLFLLAAQKITIIMSFRLSFDRPTYCGRSCRIQGRRRVNGVTAPAQRSQHINTTYRSIVGPAFESSGQTIATFDRNIVGFNMLSAFGHPVAMCCDMPRHVLKIELVRMSGRNIGA